ncbi:Arc family DNA-binding protein [Streptomyces sp. NPDC088354]|uniref:Arc family DNA-binding protein n=1 Tax=Streptomyces sp. NPDC088354 TaxID=3365856 RepID=UPI0037F2AE86
MSDANVRIPAEARDRLAEIAAAEGLSLRAYLARLADSLLTPAERAERAEQARAVLKEWNGYAPTRAEQDDLDAELDRRLTRATTAR